jgi:hypothetical protein
MKNPILSRETSDDSIKYNIMDRWWIDRRLFLSVVSKHGCGHDYTFAFFAAFPLPALALVRVETDMELLYDMEVAGVGDCGVG